MMHAMGESTYISFQKEAHSIQPQNTVGNLPWYWENRGVRTTTACLGNIKPSQKGYKMDLQTRFILPGDYCKNRRASFLCHCRGVDSPKGNRH